MLTQFTSILSQAATNLNPQPFNPMPVNNNPSYMPLQNSQKRPSSGNNEDVQLFKVPHNATSSIYVDGNIIYED